MKSFSNSKSAGDIDYPAQDAAPRLLTTAEHSISNTLIGQNALAVIDTLTSAGFETYLVGGSVRDLLMGKQPKDFDVATSARPEQIKFLFRRARIVGRRFQIVHVQFGREIIEVTTFRADHASSDDSRRSAANRIPSACPQ